MKRFLMVLLCLVLSFSLFATGGKVAVVLSGGGARGFAEVAVFEKMEEYGIPVDMVLGTSMGALLGSLYSVGYSPKGIDELVKTHDLSNILLQMPVEDPFPLPEPFKNRRDNVFTLGFSKKGLGSAPGVLGDQKLLALLNECYAKVEGITDFDKLPIPFRAVSTNAATGGRIVYDHGSLVTAVRSSISLPMVFAPYPQDDGSLAMDGGMSDNLPIQLAKDLGADFVVAMDVNALQRLTPEEMNTFSAVASQCLVITTQTNSLAQYKTADILLFPEVGNFGTLAFDRYDQILQKGRDICEANDDAFKKLAEEVQAAGRTLVVKSPDRESEYTAIKPKIIEKVMVINRSSTDPAQKPMEATFHDFVGRTFDDDARKDLSSFLDRIRVVYQLSSITYTVVMGQDDGHIILNIGYNTFDVPQYRLTLGGSSSAGFSNNTPSSFGWFRFDAILNMEFTNLTKQGLDMRLWFRQDNASSFGFRLGMPFVSRGGQTFGLHALAEVQEGGLSVLTNTAYGDRYAPLDVGVVAKSGFGYQYADMLRINIDGLFTWTNIHQTGKNAILPGASMDIVWDSLKQKVFIQNGTRFDLLAVCGWENAQTFRRQYRIAFRQDISIRPEFQGVSWSVSASCMRFTPNLNDSYLEIGGILGIPGYSLATLRQDTVLASLSWRYRLGTLFGCPFFLSETLGGGIFNPEDPFNGEYLEGGMFSSGIDWDVGLLNVVVFETPAGNYGVGFGLSAKLKFSIAIGVFD